ncbi:hypothetical protein VTI74DRAFT_1604 [Chaetomium olivicolor]
MVLVTRSENGAGRESFGTRTSTHSLNSGSWSPIEAAASPVRRRIKRETRALRQLPRKNFIMAVAFKCSVTGHRDEGELVEDAVLYSTDYRHLNIPDRKRIVAPLAAHITPTLTMRLRDAPKKKSKKSKKKTDRRYSRAKKEVVEDTGANQ